jgi:hypothetical protein
MAQHERQPRLAVKWSPFHLAYLYPSLQVAVEHKLSRLMTMQHDAGIILNYETNNSSNYSNMRGYRLISEVRHYIPSPPRIPMYMAIEGYYTRVHFDRQRVVGYDCAPCSYYQEVDYQVKHTNTGGGLKFGMLLYPWWKLFNKRFFFDINIGIAVRSIHYTNHGMPEGDITEFEGEGGFLTITPDESNHIEPRPVLGLRTGFRIL